VELQLVGPKGSEIRTYSKLKNIRETVTVPILPDVNQYGGSFEVDLGEEFIHSALLSGFSLMIGGQLQ
jgi:hypothetical protein